MNNNIDLESLGAMKTLKIYLQHVRPMLVLLR